MGLLETFGTLLVVISFIFSVIVAWKVTKFVEYHLITKEIRDGT